jgi:ABC-type sugar transport system ATPase subunit
LAPVVLESLSKVYGGPVTVLHQMDLEIYDRELLVLVGPSGCGKTTTLRLIAGLEPPTSGEIRIAGRAVRTLAPRRRFVSLVPEGGALIGHRNVSRNLSFGLELRYWPGIAGVLRRGFLGWSSKERRIQQMIARQVLRTARQLGIEGLLDRRPAQLSAGERSRVALGRAIVRRPGLFLLDEPLANLDPPRRIEMRAQLAALTRALGTTTVCVTHDHGEAMALGDRIAVMQDGRVAQVGTPAQVYSQPVDRRVAGFLGGMNFVEGQLVETAGALGFVARSSGVRLPVPAESRQALTAMPTGASKTGAITLGLRFQAIGDGSQPGVPLAADVLRLEWQGESTLATLRLSGALGGEEMQARFPARQAPREPGRMEVRVDLAGACWFDAATGKNVALDRN